MDIVLSRQIECWRKYWNSVADSADVQRQLKRLRWLEEFAFHCGPEIRPDDYRALQQQIEMAEKKLAELRGDSAGEVELASMAE